MTLGSLFAGIGGFELAATWAGITPVWSNEIDKSACNKLRKNFTHEIIEKDIRQIGRGSLSSVNIISGGDPCQPHSVAGLGKGEDDNRFLWPEMFRVVRELHPAWVVNENVDGSISNGILDRKITDLEGEGYACQAYDIPSEAVGALHRRQRIWLVAYDSSSNASNRNTGIIHQQKGETEIQERDKIQHFSESVNLRYEHTYTNSKRLEKQHTASKSENQQEGVERYFGFGSDVHGNITRNEIKSGIIRMLNGLPEGMDYTDRNKRIKELGNAIVPQVAYEIFKAIVEIDGRVD